MADTPDTPDADPLMPMSPQAQHVVSSMSDIIQDALADMANALAEPATIDPDRLALKLWRVVRTETRPVRKPNR